MPPPIDPHSLLQNPDGTVSSEYTKSFQVAELNSGKETLIPTVVDGKKLTDEEAIRRAIETGVWKSFESIPKANAYAKHRSETGALSAHGPLGQPRGGQTMIGSMFSGLGGMAGKAVGGLGSLAGGVGSSLMKPYLDESGSFSLSKLLQDSEFSMQGPNSSFRIGDRNKRIKDALMKRVEEMTLGKTPSITTNPLDVTREMRPDEGLTAVFRPNPFQTAKKSMFQGPQRLRMM